MKKLFTILAAALFSVSMMADDYALASGSFAADKMTATVDGQIFVLSSAHGGNGDNKYADFGGDCIKLTKNTTYTITLPYGFKATNVNIKGYSNDNNKVSHIVEFNGVETSKEFPHRDQTNKTTSSYDFELSEEAESFSFKVANEAQISVLITITGTPASCTPPSIAWNVEPEGGKVGDADFVASVTTTPAEGDVVWTSSNEEVATVTNGTIHYVGIGSTTITASFTYDGEDFCKTTVNVAKAIFVPIDAITPGENDRVWYYQTAIPASKPDNGLNYDQTITAAPLYGIKLNSGGYAWFAKPDVAGTLRIGAYYKDSNTKAYEVNVFACNEDGTGVDVSSDTPLGVLSTASAGVASNKLAIAKDVKGIYLKRKTQNEGVLYFVEFEADRYSITVADNIENGTIVADKAQATAGEKVVITATPTGTYKTALVTVNGTPLALDGAEISFTMPAEDVVIDGEFTQSGYPTAVDNAEDGTKAVKFIENGQMFIKKNGVVYNVLGTIVR